VLSSNILHFTDPTRELRQVVNIGDSEDRGIKVEFVFPTHQR
jgi:hypothetical protein